MIGKFKHKVKEFKEKTHDLYKLVKLRQHNKLH